MQPTGQGGGREGQGAGQGGAGSWGDRQLLGPDCGAGLTGRSRSPLTTLHRCSSYNVNRVSIRLFFLSENSPGQRSKKGLISG